MSRRCLRRTRRAHQAAALGAGHQLSCFRFLHLFVLLVLETFQDQFFVAQGFSKLDIFTLQRLAFCMLSTQLPDGSTR